MARASGSDLSTSTGAASSPAHLPIREVADATGLTTRTIRYYEQMGLLTPAGRSSGQQRRYDPSDLERLRTIRDLGESGFSLAEIAELLEDEAARERGRAAFHATDDPAQRLAILDAAKDRYERRIDSLDARIQRLSALRREAAERLALVEQRRSAETRQERAPREEQGATA